MGYYTHYELKTPDTDMVKCRLCGTFVQVDYKVEISQEIGYNPFDEECKWYSHEKDMRKFSLLYPDVLFTLNGEGEESGDIWVEYYLHGKMQREKIKIQLSDFNVDMLE